MNSFKKNIYKNNLVGCVNPILNSVTYLPTNDVTFDVNVNGFNYGTGTMILQYMVNNNNIWNQIDVVAPQTGIVVKSITNVISGTPIKYRVECFGNGCNNQISNVIDGGNWQGNNLLT